MVDHNLNLVPGQKKLEDEFSRIISYLRLSLTDRCNLRCLYCVTDSQTSESIDWLTHEDLFTYEELVRVVRVAVAAGMSKLRLTGGEPLIRRNVMYFIRQLADIEGLNDIRITTNGVMLEKYAERLFEAGIRKINISLDTLQPERFKKITGRDYFDRVWRGIEKVLDLGFGPVKLNMVVMRGINDDELLDFARLSLEKNIQARFIEFMPIGCRSRWSKDTFMGFEEILEKVRGLGSLQPLERESSDGPARVYTVEGAPGTLGFISPMSHHFCEYCNRMRLTSDGKLRPCFLSDKEIDLKKIVRSGGSDEDIRDAILSAVRIKPGRHRMSDRLQGQPQECNGYMSRIGG